MQIQHIDVVGRAQILKGSRLTMGRRTPTKGTQELGASKIRLEPNLLLTDDTHVEPRDDMYLQGNLVGSVAEIILRLVKAHLYSLLSGDTKQPSNELRLSCRVPAVQSLNLSFLRDVNYHTVVPECRARASTEMSCLGRCPLDKLAEQRIEVKVRRVAYDMRL